MKPCSLIVVPGFAPEVPPLRKHFEERFADPRSTDGGRFVWDYWHVPGQYTALRTPAWEFFPEPLYRKLHERLVRWGRENLGCHDISPPWMSCYVEGCRQELHGDLPHGPWAFVLSLTPWRGRKFKGGETLLLKEEILDFWNSPLSGRGLEEPGILREVPARFNQLVVFDPRIPHGVRRVEGVHDPREGRLVIHGWFMQPRPFIEGPLPERALEQAIESVTAAIEPLLAGGLRAQGTVSVRFSVSAAGRASGLRLLTQSLRPDGPEPRRLVSEIRKALLAHPFPKARGTSKVTLPFVFEG